MNAYSKPSRAVPIRRPCRRSDEDVHRAKPETHHRWIGPRL
jgi:hypothetical protein